MSDYKLCGCEDPRTGKESLWITKDGRSICPEDLVDDCNEMQAEIERLRAVEEAHIAASAEDAKRIAELEAMHETSLEVICAREQHVESQRIEIGRLRQELTEAMHYGAELAQERDEARDAIRRWRDLTLVMGSHRTCCCNACEALRQEVSDE